MKQFFCMLSVGLFALSACAPQLRLSQSHKTSLADEAGESGYFDYEALVTIDGAEFDISEVTSASDKMTDYKTVERGDAHTFSCDVSYSYTNAVGEVANETMHVNLAMFDIVATYDFKMGNKYTMYFDVAGVSEVDENRRAE